MRPLKFPKPPMKHQKKTIAFLNDNDVVFDMSDPGTGKTYSEIIDFAKKRYYEQCGALLVIAPRALLQAAWGDDIEKFAPWLTYSIARANNREAAFQVDVDVYIINTDGVNWLAKQPPKFWTRFKGGVLCIDESDKYKHATSDRSKALNKIKKYFKVRRALSGTPNSRTITDIWHQVFILDDGAHLGKSFYGFRSQVCAPKQVGPSPNMVEWTDKPGCELAVAALLKDITIRHKLEECIELPPNYTYVKYVDLSPKLRKHYEDMKTQALIEIEKAGGVEHVSAVNAAVVAGKLLQIASGGIYGAGKEVHNLCNARNELVADLVEEAGCALVWFFWDHQRDALLKEIKGRKINAEVYGGSDKARTEQVRRFQAGELDVLLLHPQSAGHGLTLTRATRSVLASPTYDATLYKQLFHRNYRNGQTKKTETIIVCARDTRDEAAYDKCTGRLTTMAQVLGFMEQNA